MRVARLQLANWRNFKAVDLRLANRVFVFGPNASGKSNLLDSLRFLRELTVPGGGLQSAVANRGGMSRVRFVNARNYNRGAVTVAVTLGHHDDDAVWRYELVFTAVGGADRPMVVKEHVEHNGETVYSKSFSKDDIDPALASQTALEQVAANGSFRQLATYLAGVEYLHLVPQIVREASRNATLGRDPFGGTFLADIGGVNSREWTRRQKVMTDALRAAVPQFESLDRHQDRDGTWHLRAKYTTWRPKASAQDERDFSDGTLRLLGLLWVLLDRSKVGAPVLLEEPELSLHADILRLLPEFIAGASRSSKRQVMATTHGTAMLDDPGLGAEEVVLLVPGDEGTTARTASEDEEVVKLVESGSFTLLEALKADLTVPSIRNLVSLKMT
jgi:predicted ATPase